MRHDPRAVAAALGLEIRRKRLEYYRQSRQ
jgi:hypothetical protein